MAINFFRHSWGAFGPGAKWQTLPAFVHAAADEGYDGVEVTFGDFTRGAKDAAQTEADFKATIAEMAPDPAPKRIPQHATFSTAHNDAQPPAFSDSGFEPDQPAR